MPDGKYIRCLNCWKLYVSNTNLVDHWNNGQCMHHCIICGQSFHQNIDDLTKHSMDVHGVKPITSFVWPKEDPSEAQPPKPVVAVPSKKVARKKSNAPTTSNAIAHMKGIYPCSICKRRFNSPFSLKMHKVKSHNNRLPNPIAAQLATSSKAIRPKTEPAPNALMHVCPVCDKGFAIQSSLMMHMRYHKRKPVTPSQTAAPKVKQTKLTKWQCKVCAKLFSIESVYKEHLLTHLTKTESDDAPPSIAPVTAIIPQPKPPKKTTMPLLPKQITVRRATISSMPTPQNAMDNARALMPPPPRSSTPMPELLVPMKYSDVLKYHPPITSRPKSVPKTNDDAYVPRLQVKKLVDLQDPNENRRRNSIDSYATPESQPYQQQHNANGSTSTFVIEHHRDRDVGSMNNGYNDSIQSQEELLQMPPPRTYPATHRSYQPNPVHEHQYYDPLPLYSNYSAHMPNTSIPMHEHDHGYYANNFYGNN